MEATLPARTMSGCHFTWLHRRIDLMAKHYSKFLTRPLHFDENLYFLNSDRCLSRVVQDLAVPNIVRSTWSNCSWWIHSWLLQSGSYQNFSFVDIEFPYFTSILVCYLHRKVSKTALVSWIAIGLLRVDVCRCHLDHAGRPSPTLLKNGDLDLDACL